MRAKSDPAALGHRHADARLQDAVAARDASGRLIDLRTIQGMARIADQLARGVARQPRVGVERQAVAHRRQDLHRADLHREARVPVSRAADG